MITTLQSVEHGQNQIGQLVSLFRQRGAVVITPRVMHFVWQMEIARQGAESQFRLVTPQYVRVHGIPDDALAVIADQVIHKHKSKLLRVLCRTDRPVWLRGATIGMGLIGEGGIGNTLLEAEG